MEATIFKYKRSRIILMVVLILFWLALMTFSIIEITVDKDYRISTFIWLVLGTGYMISYSYTLYKHYITIKGDWLFMNTFPFKKINLNELTEVKTFAGDYTLKTDKNELLINTQLMDESSRKNFESVIDKSFPKADQQSE